MTAAIPTRHPPGFDSRWLGEVLALAALYFLTARLGLLMAMSGAYVTPVWPPSGIALAAVLLRGRRVWPGIWLGSFVANFWHFYGSRLGLPAEMATAATIGIGASLTALLGADLLRRFVGERNPLERVQDVCAFMALGGVVSCLASATIGATALGLAGYIPWPGYGQAWLTWWLGDTGGVFIVAPLLLVWGAPRRMAAGWMELFGGFGLMITATYYVFCENTAVVFTGKALTFVFLIPFLVWAALRTGQRGAAAAVGLIALLAVWGTIHQTGPFNLGTRNEALLLLEMFLAVLALTALCLAAMVTEREQVAAEQQRAVEELESHVRERTSALIQSEKQAYQHLGEAERARAALLSILEDQQQVEEKLRESQARLQLLVKSANIGLWDWNLITNEVFFSLEWKSQLGYADDEVPGRYEEWESRLHPEDRESSLRAVHEFRAGRRNNYDIEFRLRHKNGSWRSILARADLIRDETGQPVRMMGCHVDITDRKQAEAALRESEERFRLLAEVTNDAIWDWDLITNELWWNEGFETLFGYSRGEIEKTIDSWYNRVHPDERGRVISGIHRIIDEGGTKWSDEYRFLCEDGNYVYVLDRGQVIRNSDGKAIRMVGGMRDLTERNKAEEASQAFSAELLRAQDDERRRIARELHDSTAQELAVVAMNLSRLEEWIEGRDPWAENLLADSLAVLNEGNRDLRTLAHLLHPPMLEELGLIGALRDYVEGFSARSGVEVKLEFAEDFERCRREIETALFRVVQESLSNVHRHSESKFARVKLARVRDMIELTVADRGRGLPAGLLTGAAKNARVGVGISGMRQRMTQLRGRLEINSSEMGTTIRAILPFRPKALYADNGLEA